MEGDNAPISRVHSGPDQTYEPLIDNTYETTEVRQLNPVHLLENGREHPEQTENLLGGEGGTYISEPTIVAPAPVRPAPGPVQPPQQQSIWAKKARLSRRRSGSPKVENGPSYPPVSLKNNRHSYVPVVPSPLNPAASGSEGDVSLSGRPSQSSVETGEERASGSNSGSGSRSRSVEISASSEPTRKSQNVYSTAELPQVSLMDLGREYDRYPARTPRNSMMSINRISVNRTPYDTPPKRHSFPLAISSEMLSEPDEKDLEKYHQIYIASESVTKPNFLHMGFPLYLDEKEADDYMHNPEEGFDEKRDPILKGIGYRGVLSFFSFWLFIAGLICLFIVLPILTFTGHVLPSDGGSRRSDDFFLEPWEYVETDYEFPILSGIRTTMIDPDTPDFAKTRKSVTGETLKLVFSDEFNVDGRTFYDGDDQFWTAADLWYSATQDLEWYDPDAVSTEAGTLRLKLDAWPNHDLQYRSGMLQSWNKLCFKGGVIEVSASLPGPGDKAGLWPGIWTLGNLARPGYLATTEGVWPYAYDDCDVGITPNQSSPDGISYLPGQKLNKCTCSGEDHPNPGVGRGAPEIDALEASMDGTLGLGVASQSLQLAPYDIWYIPDYDYLEIHNYSVTDMNTWRGGPFQQAISGITTLNPEWYDGKAFQIYAFEYAPGTSDGRITWFVGDEPTYTMNGGTIRQNGNIGHRHVSQEPMSIILNLGVSNSWTYIDWPALKFPTTMYIDYVRIYQPEDAESVTCDPPGFPTTDYIKEHMNAYTNPNFTRWDQAGYDFPKNTLMHGCKA